MAVAFVLPSGDGPDGADAVARAAAATQQPQASMEVQLPARELITGPSEQVAPAQLLGIAHCRLPVATEHPCAVVQLRSTGSSAPPVVLDDRAVVLIEGRTVARLELPRGTRTWWSSPFASDPPAAVLAADGLLFATAREGVVRLDPASGEVVWRTRPDLGLATAPAIRWFSDVLLMLDEAGRLTALEPEDGQVRWQVPAAGTEILRVAPDGWSTSSRRSALPATPRPARPGPDGTAVVAIDGVPGIGSVVLTPTAVDDEVAVTALDPGGRVLWDAGPLPLPCCSLRQAEGADDLLVLAAETDVGAILEAATGTVLDVPRVAGSSLVGADRRVGVWREEDRLVGRPPGDATEVFAATGRLAAVAPIIIQRDARLVHVALGDRLPSSPPTRPLR